MPANWLGSAAERMPVFGGIFYRYYLYRRGVEALRYKMQTSRGAWNGAAEKINNVAPKSKRKSKGKKKGAKGVAK